MGLGGQQDQTLETVAPGSTIKAAWWLLWTQLEPCRSQCILPDLDCQHRVDEANGLGDMGYGTWVRDPQLWSMLRTRCPGTPEVLTAKAPFSDNEATELRSWSKLLLQDAVKAFLQAKPGSMHTSQAKGGICDVLLIVSRTCCLHMHAVHFMATFCWGLEPSS